MSQNEKKKKKKPTDRKSTSSQNARTGSIEQSIRHKKVNFIRHAVDVLKFPALVKIER